MSSFWGFYDFNRLDKWWKTLFSQVLSTEHACRWCVNEWGRGSRFQATLIFSYKRKLENRWAQRLCSRAIPQPMAHFPFWYNYYFFTVCAVDLLGLSFTGIPDLHPEQKVTKVRSSSSFVWAMKVSENLWKTFGVNENQWKTNARKKEK